MNALRAVPGLVGWLVLVTVATAAGPAPRTLEQHITVDALGNARFDMKWSLPRAEYDALIDCLGERMVAVKDGKPVEKDGKPVVLEVRPPAPESVLAWLDFTSLGVEVEGLTGKLDSAAHTISAQFQVSGWAKNLRGRWRLDLLDDARWYAPFNPHRPCAPLAGTVAFRLASTTSAGSSGPTTVTLVPTDWLPTTCRIEVTLPAGATGVRVEKNRLSYKAPRPAGRGGNGDQEPELRLQGRTEVLAALHKLYGDPKYLTHWLARTTFKNASDEVLTGYRMRYRLVLPGMPTEWTEWTEVASIVYPDQVVSQPLFAILPPQLCNLQSQTTATLNVEYEYCLPNHEKVQQSADCTLDVLGVNDAMMSCPGTFPGKNLFHHWHNAPLVVSSFVSAADPVVRDLAGQVAHATGGAYPIGGRTVEDREAATRKVLDALYGLLRTHVAYKGAWTADRGGRLVQRMNYGRNVLQNHAGNCIDLAMLYASVMEAYNVDAGVVLVPGHAFPIVRVPNSNVLIPLEATMCGGGTLATSDSFDWALLEGQAKWNKWTAEGTWCVVYPRDLRHQGVPTPELPPVGANPLKDWSINTPELLTAATIQKVVVKPNVFLGPRAGTVLFVDLTIRNPRGKALTLEARVLNREGRPLKGVSEDYRGADGDLVVRSSLTEVRSDTATGKEVPVFLPASETGLRPGAHEVIVQLSLWEGRGNDRTMVEAIYLNPEPIEDDKAKKETEPKKEDKGEKKLRLVPRPAPVKAGVSLTVPPPPDYR